MIFGRVAVTLIVVHAAGATTQQYYLHEGVEPTVYTIATLAVGSVFKCAHACDARSLCRSFAWIEASAECRLHPYTWEDADEFTHVNNAAVHFWSMVGASI